MKELRLTEIKIYAQAYIAIKSLLLILFKVRLFSISYAASLMPNSFQILGILVTGEGIHKKKLMRLWTQQFDQKDISITITRRALPLPNHA